jgi:hypothetical protein
VSRPRTNSVPLEIDVDGFRVSAQLRPPGGGRGCWHVRWKAGGRWLTRATGKMLRFEAEQAARDIVRGRPVETPQHTVLSFERFEEVQKKHYALNANQKKAERTLKKFMGVVDDLKRFLAESYPGRTLAIQHINDQVALGYLDWLKKKGAAAHGIKSKVGTLRAAWNRVRRGHPRTKKTISDLEKVAENPWESINSELPQLPKIDPVQLDLAKGELKGLLDAFRDRPVAQLFVKASMWAGGRLEEMTLAQWDWVDEQGYIDIPDDVAKWGKGRVVRLPLSLLKELEALRVSGSPYVFAGFVEEYRRQSEKHSKRMREYNAGTYHLICKHIVKAAKTAGLDGISHHALRRTAMELSDQGEEIKATDESSRNLGTTTRNKQGFYVRKSHGRTFYLRADRLYEGLSRALLQFPAAANLMDVEDRFRLDQEVPSRERVRRLLDELEALSAEDLLELERQKVKRRRKEG